MKLTNIIKTFTPLLTAFSMACTPVQVKETSVENPKPTVTHEKPKVTYIAKQEPNIQNKKHITPVWNPSTTKFGDGLGYQSGNGYGRIHGLGKVDSGYATGRDANVGIGKKRRMPIPPLSLKPRKQSTVTNFYKNQSNEFTKNACRSYVSSIQNMRKNDERYPHFGSRSQLENKCIKSAKNMCKFNGIKENRTDNVYRSCVKINMYDGFIAPGF